jgi:PiT family inorganic phosphate transporter
MEPILWLTLVAVLAAEFVNGWTDAPNAIATVVSTKVMTPRQAVIMAVILNVLGTLSGTAVAYTIGKGIVDINVVTPQIILVAMFSLILWGTLAARFGIPTSESHALVAGLTGAVLYSAGPKALLAAGWIKVGYGLIASTVLGFGLSWILTRLVIFLSPLFNVRKSQSVYGRLQIFSSMFMAYNHGMNDGQKFIGMFVMALVVGGILPQFGVPLWVILLCSLTMGIGTSIGGWKIIRKVGMQMVTIKPWQGFASETGASITILFASLLGIPLSTTHTINTAIMGSAGATGMKKVNWKIAGSIVFVWLLTFPGCALIAFIAAWITDKVFIL